MTRGYIPQGAELGELLCHWHSSSSDPIYAVGSFLLAGWQHYRGVVKLALNEIERDARKYDAVPTAGRTRAAIRRDRFGWGSAERRELAAIIRGLKHMLETGEGVSDDPKGLVSQNWLDTYEPKDEEEAV